jgi:hypothetical protein
MLFELALFGIPTSFLSNLQKIEVWSGWIVSIVLLWVRASEELDVAQYDMVASMVLQNCYPSLGSQSDVGNATLVNIAPALRFEKGKNERPTEEGLNVRPRLNASNH